MNSVKLETLPGGTSLFTSSISCITTDSLLLADFCQVKYKWRVCDLCSGGGILLFSLLDKGVKGHAVGVEINPALTQLAQRSLQQNQFSQVDLVCMDIKDYRQPQYFDLVVANPPYFKQGLQAEDESRALARHQIGCTLEDVCQTAFQILKDGGRFCICWPAEDFAHLACTLANQRLAPKRIQFVRRTSQDTARLVLLEARKNGGNGVHILPDRLLPQGESIHY